MYFIYVCIKKNFSSEEDAIDYTFYGHPELKKAFNSGKCNEEKICKV